jgi:hypothetical protein
VPPLTSIDSWSTTLPAVWKSGIALSNRSSAPNRARRATNRALLIVPWCVMMAPFGAPVVPLVNWI